MSTPTGHSKYSASGFEAATLCPGKRVMEKGKPDSSSKYADEGTAAHSVLDMCVQNDRPALAYLGRRIPVGLKTWEVTQEMAGAVQTALDNIKQIVGDGMLLSEQQVNYSTYLAVPKAEAWGTSDIIALRADELQVHDYKHGMGVEVDAEENPQMKLYALGALTVIRAMGEEPTTVRLVIHQPRIKSSPSEWTLSVVDLEDWGLCEARRAVDEQMGAEALHAALGALSPAQWEEVYLRPNEKSCKFCRAKSTCPALRADATRTVFEVVAASPDEFDNLKPAEAAKHSDDAWLSKVLQKADLIEDYLKAVRAEVETRLLAGGAVPGFKLVQGKRGNRAWSDEKTAEANLVAIVGDAAYAPRQVITPTQAEKAVGKAGIALLAPYITQSDGKKHVAPVSDPRPALTLTAPVDDFDVVS